MNYSEYIKYIYEPFYYAYINKAYYRERYDSITSCKIIESYIGNILTFKSIYNSGLVSVVKYFVSDYVRQFLSYKEGSSRVIFEKHKQQHYFWISFLSNVGYNVMKDGLSDTDSVTTW